ncbi:MAG: hypothetical protein LUI06_04565 [Ruminococcus sp.]|nr:hypothetical protein [Ruminococcus sp.]
MARMPNCTGCKFFMFPHKKCEKYPEEIPSEIFVEDVECEWYEDKEIEVDENLPKPSIYHE